MSLARLLLSGVLIAAGLVLGAFTLHGYLDPNWPQSHLQAANALPVQPPVVDPTKGRERFVDRPGEQPAPPAATGVVKAAAKPAPVSEAKADAKAPAKPAVKRKVADKQPEKPAAGPQQVSVGFPWNLFANK